jgi:hypothetical protein
LGEGTYGQVWLAREERTNIRVAIKFFSHGTSLQWQLVQAEVKQLALLHADPGIVQLLDVELDASPPYYIMAYAEQGSLARRLERGPLSVAEALEVFGQVAEALAYVHAKGIRHCDLKPGNILLNARRALIADFGQAHLSSDATPALGTFFYMAPEQADLAQQIPDTRWDVYGLGAVFFAMVTGHPPHEDLRLRDELARTEVLTHRLERYRNWVASAPRPRAHRQVPGMDRPLIDLIDRCLEADPARRLHDAGAVLAALRRRERQRRQRPLLVFGLVAQVLLFVLMAGIGFWAVHASITRSEEALTRQLLRSDQFSASLVARALEKDLGPRKKEVERYAAKPAVLEALKAGDEDKLAALLGALQDWVVVNARGEPLAGCLEGKSPRGPGLPKDYRWRDWFSGQGDQPEKEGHPFPPIVQTHISQPFMGKVNDKLMIGISTPVRDPAKKQEIVGVLYTRILLRDIHSWLDRVETKGGFAVLVDRRGYCLRHERESQIRPAAGQDPPRWDCPIFREAVRQEGSTDSYVDPVDGRTYLAGYAPLPELGWGALVQQERGPALAPTAELRRQMFLLGAVLLVGVCVVVSGLWVWLLWVLRRRDRLVQG